ncbi:hypothetical protein LO762_05340 [Actinocorallia sp. API 0066]|uniref:hypothetical protein n=1 Tax=Actinocorallia sp. API 0066 TaxID=2896846 RepID=UPI001E63B287|nr:hypothetical protein [Actinocorallia sp. API 0066]MCD0448621.1 hypothetical protein [Actinocorallia sp. API 0066]
MEDEFGRMRDVVGRWHQVTGDVVRVVRARIGQLEAEAARRDAEYAAFLAHPDLAALDLTLENWYGDGDGRPGRSPG